MADRCDLSLGDTKEYKGEIDTYPVVAELRINSDATVSGRYAYKSTLRKYGDNPSSWFKVNGEILADSYGTPYLVMELIHPDSKEVYEYAILEMNRGSWTGNLINKKYIGDSSPETHTFEIYNN